MARRTSERLSAATRFTADGSGDDERESWLCRSTICADEEDDGNDTDACSWAQMHTPIPLSMTLVQRRDSDEWNTWTEFKENVPKETEEFSSSSQSRKGKRKLPLLSGFSNAEALRRQLPSASKQAQVARGTSAAKGNCKINAEFEATELSPSRDEIEANRRKWDLERKLQDADRKFNSEKASGLEQKHDLRPVAPTTAEVEANRRKWDLERRLQDSALTGVSVDSTSGSDRKRDLRRKLQSLNPFVMKMNPPVPSAVEVEANLRKWALERRLNDAHRIDELVNVATGSEQNCELTRKLPTLNPRVLTMNPVAPSAAEVEADRRKWDLERRLYDDSVNAPQKCGLRRKLENLNPFAINPIIPSADEVEANRRKWDLERRLHDGDHVDVAVNAGSGLERQLSSTHKLPLVKLVASFVPGSRPQRDMESKLCSTKCQLELKVQMAGSERAGHQLELEAMSSPLVARRGDERFAFEINESLVYLILFSSTAVLHCAIFNFSLELRQFLRLNMYPFGILLLLCWTLVGLIHFVGGLVGDLVRHRVLLLRRTAVLWGVAVVAFHVAAFQMSPLVSSMSMVSGLLCGGIAHGIICPNVIALGVESKLCSIEAVSTPLSPEDSSSEEVEEDSSAESEASYISGGSSAMSDDGQQQQSDFESHNFFTGCFAARLAGSTLVQGYYFLLVNVDTFSAENLQTTMASRGFHCMLLMSFGLMASLIYFCVQSWNYRHSDEPDVLWESTDDQKLELKLATLEQDFNASIEALWTWSWTNLVHLCNRVLVGYALLAFVLMTLIGAGVSLVVVLLASQTSLPVRLVAFLLTVMGWLLTMVASSRQLNPTKKQLVRVCRRLGVSPFVLPRSCGAVHSEFTFIWTSPYMMLLGVSDALFRVSLQEACHDLARGSSKSRRWTGTVQGAISFAESLGYTTALSLVTVLSRWLFHPESTDMALFFLLLTTVVALTHAMLNRIAARAQDYQCLYFPVRRNSAR
ncbi:hypothetical protein PC117_g3212 [Phytophthora cactorum]|uniref:Uncharacterized protein n=1 Tax=Phytophthora cactorum TaxID=29920 RepID=A0A8T1EFL1_9STRA|nr:hypothetical protein PC117_g3212 [Phytophthora cactorum]